MKPVPFHYTIKTNYTKDSYWWLAEANWQLNRRGGYQRAIYPIMMALVIIIAYSLIFRFSSYNWPVRIGLFALILFFLGAIPWSAEANKKKIRKAMLDRATSVGAIDKEFTFGFANSIIRAILGKETEDIAYTEVQHICHIDQYVFLFFKEGAYTISLKDFKDPAEVEEFLNFLSEKCEKPVREMKRVYF